ncbi:uncharacterized protein LOC132760463 [Ruditapes philippinarum]|uniref:uncharacterized protein LOC132760463 n=1 Tax=Ruditapes philippinarum TaxID=129788 RepID=UPI00295BF9EC|nr:uncharacterized protein LOC132760463 [Ruditapes philippinarum]
MSLSGVSLYLSALFSICNGFLINRKTTKTHHVYTTQPADLPGNNKTGEIVGAVFGVLISIVIIIVCVVCIRKKRKRDLENSRRTEYLTESSQSARVIVDTTQELSQGRTNVNNRGSEYISLQRNPNMCESNSDGEL